MATLVFGAIGTLIGGPLGGAIGSLVGREVDTAIIGVGHREGPRLNDLAASTSSYGTAIPRIFGKMRVPGTIIWATDLVEHRETKSSGKGQPSVTNYTYTSSFAVALSSRPIGSVGRIWADGNLVRGAAGDLKAAGTLRLYTGEADQDADPLIAAAEGADRAPAFRGLAYAVFEDLQLADFYNRVPALTFEVFADASGFSLQDIVDAAIDDADAAIPLVGIDGFSCDGPLDDALGVLDPVVPIDCDAAGDRLVFAPERPQTPPVALDEAALSTRSEDFGGAAGYTRKRSPPPARPPEVLRYYDVDRDYLAGLQRAAVRQLPGQPETIELPAAMTASNARALVEKMARRVDWSREQLAWRTAALDPAVNPGTIVTIPEQPGRWRVLGWEWRDTGVELSLARVVPTGADRAAASAVDAGRFNAPIDAPAAATLLAAFELPWDGASVGDAPAVYAAASSASAGWKGAALFVDHGDGNLLPLGPSGRARSVIGVAETALAAADPLLVDRSASVTIALPDDALTLVNADGRQLAIGANRALLGGEIVQFASATPLGGGRWQLSGLMRGRGGTESALSSHGAGETFVLLDGTAVALDPATVGTGPATIVATGLGDATPVTASIALRGITRRPLSPVHPRVAHRSDGGLDLRWTRRARGAWLWEDGVDVPLNEQSEAYQVTYGDLAAPKASWTVAAPQLTLDAATLASLASLLRGGSLHVRQQGSYALSEPLFLAALP